MHFQGSGLTYDADGVPLDGLFTQITIGVNYTLIADQTPITVNTIF